MWEKMVEMERRPILTGRFNFVSPMRRVDKHITDMVRNVAISFIATC